MSRPAAKVKTIPFDAAEYLDDEESIAAFLDEAMANGDVPFIIHAIGIVARARGMTSIAKDTGLSRESLYRALSEDGNPSFGTIKRVLAALNVRLSVKTESLEVGV